jgi:hypothetical protein
MKSKFIVMAVVSVFLLSSCSNAPAQPEYDEASLIDYRACVENWVAGSVKNPFGSGTHVMSPTYAEQASENCADLLHFNF